MNKETRNKRIFWRREVCVLKNCSYYCFRKFQWSPFKNFIVLTKKNSKISCFTKVYLCPVLNRMPLKLLYLLIVQLIGDGSRIPCQPTDEQVRVEVDLGEVADAFVPFPPLFGKASAGISSPQTRKDPIKKANLYFTIKVHN